MSSETQAFKRQQMQWEMLRVLPYSPNISRVLVRFVFMLWDVWVVGLKKEKFRTISRLAILGP